MSFLRAPSKGVAGHGATYAAIGAPLGDIEGRDISGAGLNALDGATRSVEGQDVLS